jgi:mannose-1-phosphate guanylyltransferase
MTDNANIYAVVLAGGYGTRLWPISRKNRPKQFLDITGEGNMLQVTIDRLLSMVPYERILVVTIKEHIGDVRKSLPDLPVSNILVEPAKRGTAPCIMWAAIWLEKIDPSAIMMVVPADHIVIGLSEYIQALKNACDVAKKFHGLVTIGLRPTEPATNYGYIQCENIVSHGEIDLRVFTVRKFIEKPTLQLALQFYESGDYLWNTGTFVWSVTTVLKSLQRFSPGFRKGIEAIKEFWTDKSTLREKYKSLEYNSIDYALLERSDDIYVVSSKHKRLDVGDINSFGQLWKQDDNMNSVNGLWVQADCEENLIYSSGPMVAMIGVKNLAVIVQDDVVLVCDRDQTQKVRTIVAKLKENNLGEYL